MKKFRALMVKADEQCFRRNGRKVVDDTWFDKILVQNTEDEEWTVVTIGGLTKSIVGNH